MTKMFALLDIHNKSNLNPEVQEQSETKVKKLPAKFFDFLIFRIHCDAFFNRHQVFLNFHLKQALKELTGINFTYT